MAKINFVVETANISGLDIIDLDSPHWAANVVRDEDWQGKQCVKADGEYFQIPKGTEKLDKVFVNANLISEFEALGLQRMMEKYISNHVKISVAK